MLVSWFVFCFLIGEAYKLINCVDKMRRSVLFSLKVGAALDENPRCLSCFALTSYHPPPFLLTFFSFSYSLLCLAGYASVVIPLSFYLPLLCHHLFLSSASLLSPSSSLLALPLCPLFSLHLSLFFITSGLSVLYFFFGLSTYFLALWCWVFFLCV